LPALVDALRGRTARARQSLKTEAKKLVRLQQRLCTDLEQTRQAPALREQAEVLKTQLGQVPRGASAVTLAIPWDPPRHITVALRPQDSAQSNVQRLFQRARGLEQGAAVIARRQAETAARMEAVAAVGAAWLDLEERAIRWQTARDRGEQPAERPRDLLHHCETWLASVRALGLTTGEAAARAPSPSGAPPRDLPKGIEAFETSDGHAVLAGRNASANDTLVTRLLRGRDWWLHVRDQAGAHVVLRWSGEVPPPDGVLAECAALAGHLSGIAKASRVEVTVCRGKHVRKVKGAPAGTVYVHGERSLRVTVDGGVIDAFYARRRAKG
jgi:predicted ribosome quality control (RQC) complex YloA/Tae2 family protein